MIAQASVSAGSQMPGCTPRSQIPAGARSSLRARSCSRHQHKPAADRASRRQALKLRARRTVYAQRAQEAVGIERFRPKYFSQFAATDAAMHFELPEPVARVHETDGERQIAL